MRCLLPGVHFPSHIPPLAQADFTFHSQLSKFKFHFQTSNANPGEAGHSYESVKGASINSERGISYSQHAFGASWRCPSGRCVFHITMPHIKSKNQGRRDGMKKEECCTEKEGVCVVNSRKPTAPFAAQACWILKSFSVEEKYEQ